MARRDVEIGALQRDLMWMRENLKLQATEYERRLGELNHAHQQAQEKEREYVSLETHNAYVKSEKDARDKAAERADEQFETFKGQYEERHANIVRRLDLQQGAALEAGRRAEIDARRLQVTIAAVGIVVTVIVLVVNHVFA